MKDSRVMIHFNHEEINVDSYLKITPENLYTRCINVLSQYILDVLCPSLTKGSTCTYTVVKKLRRSRVSQVTCTDNTHIIPRRGLVTIGEIIKKFIWCHVGIRSISTCLHIFQYVHSWMSGGFFRWKGQSSSLIR